MWDGPLTDETVAGRQKIRQDVILLWCHPVVLLTVSVWILLGAWQISWLKLQQPFAMWLTVAVSIEFYLGSQLFAHHYTGSASPRLLLERHWPCAGLFARSFIYATQISTPLLFIWDANKLVQGCCGGKEGRDSCAFSASFLCWQALSHTPTLCCHHIKC